MFTVCTIVNIAMLYLIRSGATFDYLPMTVCLVLVNILNVLELMNRLRFAHLNASRFHEAE